MNNLQSDTEPNRHLPFDGTPNFRDYGGYVTSDGCTVKWRTLFRSGQLSELSLDDQHQFAALDIQLVFDFRRDEECQRDPSLFLEATRPTIVGLPIDPGSTIGFFDIVSSGKAGVEDMTDVMCMINRDFALVQGDNYRAMFQHLLAQENGASLVHCAAGKDRTGFAVAMILAALGVPKHTIFADYMLTRKYFNIDREIGRLGRKYHFKGDLKALRPVLEVQEHYLKTAFDAIDENFPSLDNYLEDVLGMGVEERKFLRSRFLD